MLTRFFHFPINETIPLSALRETYCIPILWLEKPIYTDVSNGFFRQSVNWDNIPSHVSSNEKKRLKTLSSLTFAAHKSIIHSHPPWVEFTNTFTRLFPHARWEAFLAHIIWPMGTGLANGAKILAHKSSIMIWLVWSR